MFRIPFPYRTAHVLGMLTAVFLIGATAVRFAEQPAVSAQAEASVAALDARIDNTLTRLEVCIAAARADDAMLEAQLVALDADAGALLAAAHEMDRAAQRGFRNGKQNAAARNAAAASEKAVAPVRLALDGLRGYAAGGTAAGEVIAEVERAVVALGEARSALAFLK